MFMDIKENFTIAELRNEQLHYSVGFRRTKFLIYKRKTDFVTR